MIVTCARTKSNSSGTETTSVFLWQEWATTRRDSGGGGQHLQTRPWNCYHDNLPVPGLAPPESTAGIRARRGSLAKFHEAIFEAYERWDSHAYEFITRDEDGIALRSYVHPQLYDGGASWRPMDEEEIDRFIEQAVPDDAAEAAKERFRDLQSNPPPEGNAAETTVDELDPKGVGALSYIFDHSPLANPTSAVYHHPENPLIMSSATSLAFSRQNP